MIITLLIISILFLFIILIVFNALLSKINEVASLKRDNAILKLEIKNYKTENYAKDREIGRLLFNYNKLINSSNSITNKETVKKAIKIAMINSHPDKGGSKDDFITFKELYDKYK